jgi:hypothetical protein
MIVVCNNGCSDSTVSIGQGKYGACVFVGVINAIIESGCLLEYLRKVNPRMYDAIKDIQISDLQQETSNNNDLVEQICPKIPRSVWTKYDEISRSEVSNFEESRIISHPDSSTIPPLHPFTASDIFSRGPNKNEGLFPFFFIRAIFMDKINAVFADRSMLDLGKSSSTWNNDYPLAVFEMGTIDSKKFVRGDDGKMESIDIKIPETSFTQLLEFHEDFIGQFDFVQVSDEFRYFVHKSRARALKIASDFYLEGTLFEISNNMVVDVIALGLGPHMLSLRFCDDKNTVDICEYGKCYLDLRHRLKHAQTTLTDKGELNAFINNNLRPLFNEQNIKGNEKAIKLAMRQYIPNFLVHFFVPQTQT